MHGYRFRTGSSVVSRLVLTMFTLSDTYGYVSDSFSEEKTKTLASWLRRRSAMLELVITRRSCIQKSITRCWLWAPSPSIPVTGKLTFCDLSSSLESKPTVRPPLKGPVHSCDLFSSARDGKCFTAVPSKGGEAASSCDTHSLTKVPEPSRH